MRWRWVWGRVILLLALTINTTWYISNSLCVGLDLCLYDVSRITTCDRVIRVGEYKKMHWAINVGYMQTPVRNNRNSYDNLVVAKSHYINLLSDNQNSQCRQYRMLWVTLKSCFVEWNKTMRHMAHRKYKNFLCLVIEIITSKLKLTVKKYYYTI